MIDDSETVGLEAWSMRIERDGLNCQGARGLFNGRAKVSDEASAVALDAAGATAAMLFVSSRNLVSQSWSLAGGYTWFACF